MASRPVFYLLDGHGLAYRHYFAMITRPFMTSAGEITSAVFGFTRTLMGDGFYLMAEMHFADEAALKAAMKSPENAAAGENLETFAHGLYTLMFATED